jgi:hypothetical protein
MQVLHLDARIRAARGESDRASSLLKHVKKDHVFPSALVALPPPLQTGLPGSCPSARTIIRSLVSNRRQNSVLPISPSNEFLSASVT